MRRVLKICFAAMAIICLPVAAFASTPVAWLQVGGGPVQVLSGWTTNGSGQYFLNFAIESGDYQVSGNLTTMADPFTSYGIAFANLGTTPLLFQFGILSSITPVVDPNIVYASYSGSGTDVGGDGFAIAPSLPDLDGDGLSELQAATVNGVNMGVDVGLGYSDGPGFPGHSNNLGVYASGPHAGPGPGPWTELGLNLGFFLNGGNDIATLNGYAGIIPQPPVPEPATVALLGLGLLGAGLVRRARR